MQKQEDSIGPASSVRIGLQLWCAHSADLLDLRIEQTCVAVLSDDERDRASRFRFDRHRLEYIAAHALVRNALAHHRSLPPEAWRFCVNKHGKPSPESACDLQFNLSTCEQLVVCLVAQGRDVGVDAEPLTRGEEIARQKADFFSPAEREQLDQLYGAAQLDRAVSLWVLKEAYTKARGLGLTLPLQKMTFLYGDKEGIRLNTEPEIGNDSSMWRFTLVDHAEHRIAVVTSVFSGILENDERRVESLELTVCEARPPLNDPVRIGQPSTEWFPRAYGGSGNLL